MEKKIITNEEMRKSCIAMVEQEGGKVSDFAKNVVEKHIKGEISKEEAEKLIREHRNLKNE